MGRCAICRKIIGDTMVAITVHYRHYHTDAEAPVDFARALAGTRALVEERLQKEAGYSAYYEHLARRARGERTAIDKFRRDHKKR